MSIFNSLPIRWNSEFVKNLVTASSGNLVAQAIGFFSAPIISRLYDPSAYGIMTVIASVIGVTYLFSCLGYQNAIVLPKEIDKAHALVALCVTLSFIFAGVVSLCIALFGHSIAMILGISSRQGFLWFIPLGAIVLAWADVQMYWRIRSKSFLPLSVSQGIAQLTSAASKIIAGIWLGPSALFLIGGNILGPVAGMLYLGVTHKRLSLFVKNQGPGGTHLSVAKEYQAFPKYHTWAQGLNALSQYVPILLFSYYYSPETVGLFGLAFAALSKPVSVISQGMSNVFLQKAASTEARRGNVGEQLRKATIGLALVSVVPFVLLGLLGKPIFGMVFGEAWEEAGTFAQVLSPFLFFAVVNTPSTQIIIVKQHLSFNLIFNCVNVFLRALAIVIAHSISPLPIAGIISYSCIGIITNVFLIAYSFKIAGRVSKVQTRAAVH